MSLPKQNMKHIERSELRTLAVSRGCLYLSVWYTDEMRAIIIIEEAVSNWDINRWIDKQVGHDEWYFNELTQVEFETYKAFGITEYKIPDWIRRMQ